MADEVERLLRPSEGTDPRLGSTLNGRYRLRRKIGGGGMGAVYEADHLVIEKTVAVKILRPDLASNPEQVARFRREAIAAAKIGHPNIIDVSDMGRADDDSVYMVMERLSGQDWSDVLNERQMPLSKVVPVMQQVLAGLGAAHEAGILHRDLKPANVFVCDDGTVKLLDFGVSKILDSTGLSTSTGVAMGTPVFMSPEQIRDSKNVDERTDIYAVGVMLFVALTGTYPFEGRTIPELALKIVAEPVPSLRGLRPDVSDALEELVEGLLAKDPADRPGSCAEVARRLAAATGDGSIALDATMPASPSMRPGTAPSAPSPVEAERTPTPVAGEPSVRESSRRESSERESTVRPAPRGVAAWQLGAAAAAVAALGLGAYAFVDRSPDPEPEAPVVEPDLPDGVDPPPLATRDTPERVPEVPAPPEDGDPTREVREGRSARGSRQPAGRASTEPADDPSDERDPGAVATGEEPAEDGAPEPDLTTDEGRDERAREQTLGAFGAGTP